MSFKTSLAIAFAVVVAVPASAAAQAPVTPPDADNYLAPYFVNGGDPVSVQDVFAIQADTTNYTVQDDMYFPNAQNLPGGGPPEPTVCEGYTNPVTYGNTIWSVFQSKDYGTMDVSAASGIHDEVIRVVPFNSPEDPEPGLPGACYDDLSGSQETARGLVFPGQWYAVQVGGTISQSSPSQGGPMQIKYELSAPPKVDGDVLLFWAQPPLRVTSLKAKGVTKGARVTLICTKHACKNKKKTASKPVWDKPVEAVGPGSPSMKGGTGGDGVKGLKAFKPIAHSAATKFTFLKNKRVKKGATITVRITADGFIGKSFFWKVKAHSLTAKKISCLNPGSNKPHKPGTCHG
jgi:hypothetical protein